MRASWEFSLLGLRLGALYPLVDACGTLEGALLIRVLGVQLTETSLT